MQKCFKNGIKVSIESRNFRQYLSVKCNNRTLEKIENPLSGKTLNDKITELYLKHAELL